LLAIITSNLQYNENYFAKAISNQLVTTVNDVGLSFEHASAFCAYNTNGHFGAHNSAFQLLWQKQPNL
jgi:hypothetical protein